MPRPTATSSRTLRSADTTEPVRRSSRLAALQDRRRESEEVALQPQRERIAQTYRHVSRGGSTIVDSLLLTRESAVPQRGRPRNNSHRFPYMNRASEYILNDNNPRRPPRRRPPPRGITVNPQLTDPTNVVHARIIRRSPASMRPPAPAVMRPRQSDTPMFFINVDGVRNNVFNFGTMLGNRPRVDSEESYLQPRVIDPEAISEDESENDEAAEMRELSPPIEPPPVVHRPVTRSMSSRPWFNDDEPAPSTALPRRQTAIKKKAAKAGPRKSKSNAGSVKTVIKVEKVLPCTICYEDDPKKPVACTYCRQLIGCRYCVKKWFRTTNMSHLDARTPYPLGGTDRNHKRCPLCRADWQDAMQIVPVIKSS